MADDWRAHLLETPEAIGALLERVRTIAVLGMKPGDHPDQAAWFVPEYAQRAGFTIIPVPVYYPDIDVMLGEPVFRSVSAIPGPVDLVDVFRRPKDVPAHVEDIIGKRPRAVWMQLGIRHDESAERFARAGIDVVQDHCLLAELEKRGR